MVTSCSESVTERDRQMEFYELVEWTSIAIVAMCLTYLLLEAW